MSLLGIRLWGHLQHLAQSGRQLAIEFGCKTLQGGRSGPVCIRQA